MAHYLVRARLRPELAEELREDVLDRLLRPAGPGPGVEEEAGKGPGAAQSLHRAPHPAGVGQRNPVPGPNGHHGHHPRPACSVRALLAKAACPSTYPGSCRIFFAVTVKRATSATGAPPLSRRIRSRHSRRPKLTTSRNAVRKAWKTW